MNILIGPCNHEEGMCGVSDHISIFSTEYNNRYQHNNLKKIYIPNISNYNFFKYYFCLLIISLKLKRIINKNNLIINWHHPSFMIRRSIDGILFLFLLSIFNSNRIFITMHGYFLTREKILNGLSLLPLIFINKVKLIFLYKNYFQKSYGLKKYFFKFFKTISYYPFALIKINNFPEYKNKSKSINIIYFGVISSQKRIDLLFNSLDLINHNLLIISKNIKFSGIKYINQKSIDHIICNKFFNIELKSDIDNKKLSEKLYYSDVIIMPLVDEVNEMNSSYQLALSTQSLIILYTNNLTYYDKIMHIIWINYSELYLTNTYILQYGKLKVKRKYVNNLYESVKIFNDFITLK
jgi:hypothetical protein